MKFRYLTLCTFVVAFSVSPLGLADSEAEAGNVKVAMERLLHEVRESQYQIGGAAQSIRVIGRVVKPVEIGVGDPRQIAEQEARDAEIDARLRKNGQKILEPMRGQHRPDVGGERMDFGGRESMRLDLDISSRTG